jgi:hypothetical protein
MRKSLLREIPIFILLFAVAILAQLIFLNPPILSDQMEYYFTAIHFPHLPAAPNIGSMRIGLILPVAVLYRIFGTAEITYYALPLVSLAVLSISIYLIAGGLFSRRVGFFSALWVIFMPNLLQDSGHLLPDLPATACSAAAFAILITFFKDLEDKKDNASRKSQLILFFAGLLFGWSYLVKEYLAILFILIPIVFWMFDIPYRRLVPVAVGMLLMLALEMGFGIIYYHNPLIRFLAATPRETEGEIQKDVLRIIGYLPILLVKAGSEGILAFMGIGLLDSFRLSFNKDKRFIFLLLWVLLIYILFTFAGLLPVLFKWEGIVLLRLHKFRYWVPIIPPLIICGVAVLDRFFTFLGSKLKVKGCKSFVPVLMALFLAAASLSGIMTVQDDPDLIRNGADHYLELREYLQEHSSDQDLIWINRDNKRAFERILPMYIRGPFGNLIWQGKFKYINTKSLYLRAEEIAAGEIIVDRDFMNASIEGIPDYLYNPPTHWELVFESQNHKIAIYDIDGQ